MNRKLPHCAALALAAGLLSPTGWTESSTGEARHWLERMIQATQTLNYEGTFIYVQGPHMETMRVIHGGGPEGERQRLFSLNGPPREILAANNSIICLSPRQQPTIVGGGYQRSPFPLSIPRELGRLEGHYDFELLGEDRVAGLEARVVGVKPRDTLRYGYRLWLDQRNGMVLRSALLDDKGYPVEQLMFTDLQIKQRIDESAFSLPPPPADAKPPASTQQSPDAQAPAGVAITQSAWSVAPLPDGFVKVLHNSFAEATGRHPTEHMVFADGLATISVFLERLDGQPPLLQGESQLGSINAFGTMMEGFQVLVVGEVPAATVRRIADAIQHHPEVAKQP